MRCAVCHSYIPEGLPAPITCPQCGRSAEGSATSSPTQPQPAGPSPLKTPDASVPPPLPASTTPSGALLAEPASLPAQPPVLPPAASFANDAHARLGIEGSHASTGASSATSESTSESFAPYFSLLTSLAYSPAATNAILQHPSRGSISFGPQGLSIVFDSGRHWEKITYRDITAIRTQDDYVLITTRDTESRLTLYHPWLPPWLVKPRRTRADIFVELFTRVKSGLTPYEVSLYRRRLQ